MGAKRSRPQCDCRLRAAQRLLRSLTLRPKERLLLEERRTLSDAGEPRDGAIEHLGRRSTKADGIEEARCQEPRFDQIRSFLKSPVEDCQAAPEQALCKDRMRGGNRVAGDIGQTQCSRAVSP